MSDFPISAGTVLPLVPPSGRRPGSGRGGKGRKPLPDAVAIRAIAVPELAPPYDDAAVPAPPTARRPGRRRASAPALTVVPGTAGAGDTPAQAGHGSAAGAARPAVPAWPSQFAQVLAETLAGSRSPEQISAWTTEQARHRISQLGPLLAAAHQPKVRRVIISSPAGGVLEMSVIVGVGAHVRAVAVRLERRSGQVAPPPARSYRAGRAADAHWLCTDIEAA